MTTSAMSIQQILESIDTLGKEEQCMIHDILERRLIENNRDEWILLKEQALEDYHTNNVKRGNLDELMADLDD